MRFPTCFALSTLVLDPWDAAAIPGSRSSSCAEFCARCVGGGAGVADVADVDHVRGDVLGLGVLVPVDHDEGDGHGFGGRLALVEGDF